MLKKKNTQLAQITIASTKVGRIVKIQRKLTINIFIVNELIN